MRLLTIYGSPTPPGKLARALDDLEAGVRDRHSGWEVQRLAPVDRVSFVLATWPDDAAETVATADAVVIASPVFRAAPPGTLKLLIDTLPVEALRSTPVGLVTVAAAPEHALASERHLRDMLTWFGALQAPNASFFPDSALRSDPLGSEVSDELAELTDQVIALAERIEGVHLGPAPLAAR